MNKDEKKSSICERNMWTIANRLLPDMTRHNGPELIIYSLCEPRLHIQAALPPRFQDSKSPNQAPDTETRHSLSVLHPPEYLD